jgi:hypothetical protein
MRGAISHARVLWALALAPIVLGGALTAHRLARADHRGVADPCRTLVTSRDELCGVLSAPAK